MRLLAAPPARKVDGFELITRDGRTYRYPPPSWLDRFAAWLQSVAEPAVISAVVLGMIYFAGTIAEAIETVSADACRSSGGATHRPGS